MVHQNKPYGSVGLIFLHHAPGKQAFVHHRGREQLVPAVPRPGWQKRPCGAFLERGRVPNGAPKRSSAEWLGTFCCTIPFGAASAFAQALRFSSRGPVAKNAPQEHFLNAPADGAPETALRKRRAVFLLRRPGMLRTEGAPSPSGRLQCSRRRSASARGQGAGITQ